MSVDSTCTIIVLAGSNLYELMVTISDEGCGITSSVVKSVECTMSDLANEYNSVKTHAMYGAVVMDNTQIASKLAADSMSPSAAGDGSQTVKFLSQQLFQQANLLFLHHVLPALMSLRQ